MAAITFNPPGSFADLRCQGVAYAPVGAKAHIYRTTWNASLFCPFRNGHGFSVMLKNLVAGVVSILDFLGSPAAVIGGVVSVVVDSVERMLRRWSGSHIGNKYLKGLPGIAYANASAAVSCISMVFRSSASVVHVDPCSMLRCFGVSMAYSAAALAGLCNAFLFSVSKLAAFAHKLYAAIAAAKPELLVFIASRGVRLADHLPFAKALASQINFRSHTDLFVRSSLDSMRLSTDAGFLFWRRQRKE